ncbi:hypothetical protein SK128_018196, partial [Halocaridina rubra]
MAESYENMSRMLEEYISQTKEGSVRNSEDNRNIKSYNDESGKIVSYWQQKNGELEKFTCGLQDSKFITNINSHKDHIICMKDWGSVDMKKICHLLLQLNNSQRHFNDYFSRPIIVTLLFSIAGMTVFIFMATTGVAFCQTYFQSAGMIICIQNFMMILFLCLSPEKVLRQ